MIMVAMDWTLITGDSLVMVHLCSIIRMSGLKIITKGPVPTKPLHNLTSLRQNCHRCPEIGQGDKSISWQALVAG